MSGGMNMSEWKKPESHPWEKKENPQGYDLLKEFAEHPKPAQHILGLVGGNEAPYKDRASQVDIESDLRGTTRANTFCPNRKHSPLLDNAKSVTRDTPKEKVSIQFNNTPLKNVQMWAYPATIAPLPVIIETCIRPEKL
jgi:hypothetical protein